MNTLAEQADSIINWLGDDTPIAPDAITGLTTLRVRDEVIRQIMQHPDNWQAFLDKLYDATLEVPQVEVPVYTMAAILMWQAGNTNSALMSLGHALAEDPHYNLARLIHAAISMDMPPAVWADGISGLTREECVGAA